MQSLQDVMAKTEPNTRNNSEFDELAQQLVAAGAQLYANGMVPATSGNFSARLCDNSLAITVSGTHKGRLTVNDIMPTDSNGRSPDDRQPSAETGLHTLIYRRYPKARAVLHPHSMAATVLSRILDDKVILKNYELLKALDGIGTHECSITIPVLDNDQNITRLAAKADASLDGPEQAYAFLIRGHGFYTWGKTVNDALRHVEALDFLFECELKTRGIQS